MPSLKINHGCGSVRPSGWINTDSSLNTSLQKIPVVGKTISRFFHKVQYDNSNVVFMDLNKPWKFRDNTVDVVYTSHLLEHLTLRSVNLFLNESFRCLKREGVIRIVVPDLYKICKHYIQEYESGDKADPTEFIMWAINMHREGQYGNPAGIKKMIYEWQGYPHQHKYMYDEKSLTKRLREAGFRDILSLEYGVSRYIPEIREVEGDKENYLSVYLEARK